MKKTKGKKIGLSFLFILMILGLSSWKKEKVLFSVSNGHITFVSEAPLELIEAESEELIGLLSSEELSFAFSVNIKSFKGFNSPLQQEHFNENYMESDQFPKATFTGLIIDEVDLFKIGEKTLRAKGKFNIHGVEHTQMINVIMTISENRIQLESEFDLSLDDYEINIPKIVNKKIAEIIHVKVNATLEKK